MDKLTNTATEAKIGELSRLTQKIEMTRFVCDMHLGAANELLTEIEGEHKEILNRLTPLRDYTSANFAQAVALCAEIPIGKLIRDFFQKHNLPIEALYTPGAIPHEQLIELGAQLTTLNENIELEKERLRNLYAVLHEDHLSGKRRTEFDAELRKFIEREDQYS